MHSCRKIVSVAAAATLLGLSAVLSAQADPPKTVVAVFSQEDPQFAETITLYADGQYQQAETEKKASLCRSFSVPSPYSVPSPLPASPVLLPLPSDLLKRERDPKRTGTWRVLDKGGQTVAFKTLASLPKDAVIEVKDALPFGLTWERQRPYFLHSDRTLPAGAFQAPPPVK